MPKQRPRKFRTDKLQHIRTFGSVCFLSSPDPNPWLVDPDPAIFVTDLQVASKKIIFLHNFFCLLLFKGTRTFTSFLKNKKSKESQNNRNQGFSYYFCMMSEGSGTGSGPIPLTGGSGRSKNMWIRIHNTDKKQVRIRILLYLSKNNKKNRDSYCLVASVWLFIFNKEF